MKSTMFSLQTRDFLKGLIMAGLVPVFVIIQQSLSEGTLTFNWKSIGIASIAGFLSYIGKNFFTDGNKQAQNVLSDAAKKETPVPDEVVTPVDKK
jgi:hypothetical protein